MATNNRMFVQLQQAMEQATGQSDVNYIELTDIIDAGRDSTLLTSKDKFVNALVNVIYKNMYTDSTYSDGTEDVFYEDSAAYGAACQVISIDIPDVVANPAWNTITNGVTKLHDTPVTVPVVNGQIYGNADSWAINIAFTGEQLDTAFDSEAKLTEFYNYVRLQVENSVRLHRKTMAAMNRNAWIANTVISAESTTNPRPFRCINLIKDYCTENGIAEMSITEFLANPTALSWTATRLEQYKMFITDFSTAFTGDGKTKFVPENRLVVQMISSFENLMYANLVGHTTNNRVVDLPLHRTVAKWQGTMGDVDDGLGFTFRALSNVSVNVTEESGISMPFIVGIMVDKYAIMHTTVSRRVGVDRDDVKDITLYSYQFVDRYMNNLTLPGIVFILDDVED